jgi:hypothetical protein
MSTAPFHAGAVAKLFLLSPVDELYAVILARPPLEASPANLLRTGGLSACVTHPEGETWPDKRGEMLVRAALERGSPALLIFDTLQDALACKGRLDAEACR